MENDDSVSAGFFLGDKNVLDGIVVAAVNTVTVCYMSLFW